MLRTQNPGFFRDTQMLDTATSIDSLSPDDPVLPVILAAQRPPWIKYDNIVGRLPRDDWQVRVFGDGDGVVPYTSAHLSRCRFRNRGAGRARAKCIAIRKRFCKCGEILRDHLRELRTSYPEIGMRNVADGARVE